MNEAEGVSPRPNTHTQRLCLPSAAVVMGVAVVLLVKLSGARRNAGVLGHFSGVRTCIHGLKMSTLAR